MKKRELKSLTDIELVDLIKSETNVEKAYAEIYDRYKNLIMHLFYKNIRGNAIIAETPHDLTQMVFERAFKKIKHFVPEHKFSTWLCRIATNLSVDIARKKGVQSINLAQEDNEGNEMSFEFEDKELNPEKLFEKSQRCDFVNNLIETKLSDDYKAVIQLIFFEELSYEETAKILDIPIGTLKAKIHRAKDILRKGLTSDILITA